MLGFNAFYYKKASEQNIQDKILNLNMPSLIPHSTCNILPEEMSSAFSMFFLTCARSVLNYFLD